MIFKVSGSHDWTLQEDQIGIWRDQFPRLDVDAEVLKAQAWTDANPTRRKTARGMQRFLVNWLLRAEADRVQQMRYDDRTRRLPTFQPWECGHSPRCPHRAACEVVSMRKRA